MTLAATLDVPSEAPADLLEAAIRLPHAPTESAPAPFPIIAVIAPVGIGLALFAIIGSPFLLMFIVFGPVIAIAHLIDRRYGERRRLRRATAAFDRELAEAEHEIGGAHARMRRRRRAQRPLARDLVAGHRRIEPGIVVGTTTVPSGLRLEGGGVHPQLDIARAAAGRLDDACFSINAKRLAVHGSRIVTTGVVRALLVQLTADDLSGEVALIGDGAEAVAAELRTLGVHFGQHLEPDALAVITGADAPEFPNATVDAVLIVAEDGFGELRTAEHGALRLRLDSLGAGELRDWASKIGDAQRTRRRAAERIPSECELADLFGGEARPHTLSAAFAVGADGPCELDLVADGPHAVLGGTTGSGKSELLIAWATALAERYTSDECAMLGLDFKGGATFDALAPLPHCVGVVTDLDDGEAHRVLAGLRAEMRRREQQLRDLGVREIADTNGVMPRLVVFVDEFQALVQEHPELNEVFADLGARGRSLGIHLVLCTQRPTGVFRESLLANCAIRLSLRVEQASDSRTILGEVDAAELPVSARGRLLLRVGGGDLATAQVARARPDDIAVLAAREQERRRRQRLGSPESPWRPPLPTNWCGDEATWAIGDLPEAQQQPRLEVPTAGAHLWIIGTHGSGKSAALAALARAAQGMQVVTLGPGIEQAWDALDALVAKPDASRVLVLIDDLDGLETRFDDEHRSVFLERLGRLARIGGERGVTLAMTVRRPSGGLQRIAALCAQTLRLAASSRQEWVLQGGEAADFIPNLPPGRGRLARMLVQVAAPAQAPVSQPLLATAHEVPFIVPPVGLLVVTRRGSTTRAALGTGGVALDAVPSAADLRTGTKELVGRAPIIVGDFEQWHGAFGVLPRLADQLPVLLIGATTGDWRTLFRGDPMPPALDDPWSRGWLRHPDGQVDRVRLEDGAPEGLIRSGWALPSLG
ncbi:FtsK/SpoIIIE domain-containing protein [Gulosibacter macacae]|nr:FtsK/SpoIIIE domain-containing protein [Gulosibacter macacae]